MRMTQKFRVMVDVVVIHTATTTTTTTTKNNNINNHINKAIDEMVFLILPTVLSVY